MDLQVRRSSEMSTQFEAAHLNVAVMEANLAIFINTHLAVICVSNVRALVELGVLASRHLLASDSKRLGHRR